MIGSLKSIWEINTRETEDRIYGRSIYQYLVDSVFTGPTAPYCKRNARFLSLRLKGES